MQKNLKLVIFDLDGTLTESKQVIRPATVRLLMRLLKTTGIAVISGAAFKQFGVQFLARLPKYSALFSRLYLFPVNSTMMYQYKKGWEKAYEEHRLTGNEVARIRRAFAAALREIGYVRPKHVWGQVIENRGTQVTFSAPGQKAPWQVKKIWHDKADVRRAIVRALHKHLKGFEIRIGGLTSIDVTRKGIDKAYGVRKILRELGIKKSEALFVGDALYPDGNDAAAKKSGVRCISVSGPKETRQLVQNVLKIQSPKFQTNQNIKV